ncbi:MAG: hypothetical protein HY537_14015 [Deltaproteobacteria bacterium]|nr:hypothetical protein [Deltaproteobacteria bacterium]
MTDTGKPRAIALMSGGLDSTLAARLVKDQGVEVIGLTLTSAFGCRSEVQKSAEQIGIRLRFKDKGKEYLDLLKNPHYGYGKNMNPCIDCRIDMFKITHSIMLEEAADFIVTGEVLGQRPMSQRRDAMDIIDRDSGVRGLVLRPLSAHCMEPTLPELKGWIDREKLLGIIGRGRHTQFELAQMLGITEYGTPGGGCLLTDAGFSSRLRDFFEFDNKEFRHERSALLRYGRHFRLSGQTKVIVGRDDEENKALALRWKDAGCTYFEPQNFPGPSAIAWGKVEEQERAVVGGMILRYSKKHQTQAQIHFESEAGEGTVTVEHPLAEEQLSAYRI